MKVNGRSVGVRLARPFVFDLSEAVRAGDNEIEVVVLNTLANYMSAGPSKYVYKGQTVSGLLGPVTLRMITSCTNRVSPRACRSAGGGRRIGMTLRPVDILTRRFFLQDMALGLGGIALGSLMQAGAFGKESASKSTAQNSRAVLSHFAPRASM